MGGSYPLSGTNPPTPFLALFWRPADLHGGDSLACLAPSRLELTPALPRLPAERRALADVLPPGAVLEAVRFRAEGRAWWLILDRSISRELQDAPWESLTLGGETLAANALVVRDAAWPELAPEKPIGLRQRGSGFLNLFPKQEHDFAARLEAHVASERLTHCYQRFAREGLDRFDELIVVAHGDARGLLSSGGEHFAIETNALPRRIWLLACNIDGAMYRLARTLLARGVRSVVTSTGELSATQMAGIVDEWLSAKCAGAPEDWIRTRRADESDSGGVRALTIHGEICVDRSAASRWNRRTWSGFADGRSPRIGRNLEELERAIGMLELPETDLWPVTRHWLLADALRQAENLDHASMNRLLARVEACARDANAHYAIANAHYRRGEYARVARKIVEGLVCDTVDAESRVNLISLLANVLIDINLPKAANAALAAEKEVALQDAALDRMYKFQWLDRLSRIAFRGGRFAEAREAMEAKRQEALAGAADLVAPATGVKSVYDDSRELAWLLYFQSWEDRESSRVSTKGSKLAREVITLIGARGAADVAKGNDPIGYLLRSLACWVWATQRHPNTEDLDAAVAGLRPWFAVIKDRCSQLDPGPWAFARCFLALAGELPAEDVELAINALERARYLLEAAAFAGLAAREDIRRPLYEEFARGRAAVVAVLQGLRATLPSVVERLAEEGPDPVPM